MEEHKIKFPMIKWLTGNDIENSINELTGSYGTDPFSGFTTCTTMAYRAGFVMPKKPAKGEPPLENPGVPLGFAVSYHLVYPFGHKPAQGEEVKMFFEYEAQGGEPQVISPKVVEQAEQWLNEQLERYIGEGLIKVTPPIVY